MKKINILGHSFELENNAANFLQSYLQKLDRFGEKNGENFETIDDIKYSLIEKLYSKHQPIGEKDIFQITDQLGDPENIFETQNIENKYAKNELASNRPLIWGVAYWISKSLKLNILVVRILFLVLPFILGIFGTTIGTHGLIFFANCVIGLYVILALFCPYRAKNQKSTFMSFLEILLWIYRLFMVFIISTILCSILACGISLLISKLYIIDNRSTSLLFPSWFFSLTFIATASLIIFSLDFFLRFFNKRLFSPGVLFSLLGTSFFSFIIVGGMFGKQALQAQRNQIQVTGETQNFDTVSQENISISIPENFSLFTQPNIHILASSGENISTQIDYQIFSPSSDKSLKENLVPLVISQTGNRFLVGQSGYIGFNKVVSMNLLSMDIKFYIPKDKKVNIYQNASGFFGRNLWNCGNEAMVYSEKENDFICENTQYNNDTQDPTSQQSINIDSSSSESSSYISDDQTINNIIQ